MVEAHDVQGPAHLQGDRAELGWGSPKWGLWGRRGGGGFASTQSLPAEPRGPGIDEAGEDDARRCAVSQRVKRRTLRRMKTF